MWFDCHHVIEQRQTEAFLRFGNPIQVAVTVISIADGSSLAFFPKRLERSAAVKRFERFELALSVERLERLELLKPASRSP